ncbi:MAG: hypothetical protein IBX44_00045 [Sulfurospirillum sp.]|nr:hypothetical protein [Sulfurospirillum sp.]
MNQVRTVKDFKLGVSVFLSTIGWGILINLCLLFFAIIFEILKEIQIFLLYSFGTIFIGSIILSVIGFIVNYKPLIVENDQVIIPAADQIRTFLDFITLNPITGLYRRRTYRTDEIENVANGYTRVKRGKEREWNVVISGIQHGKSFSQRIDCSNKQVRDEIRNALKQTIKGKVNSDFAI